MEISFTKRRLNPEERRELADRTVEITVAETESQRWEREEKTARLRAQRLAQSSSPEGD